MRLIAGEHGHLDGLHERTAEQLAVAQGELRTIHWWSRGRREELQTEIARHRWALERADAKREQLRERAGRRSQFLALARKREDLSPPLRPEPPRPRLEREPPGLGLEL
jgi:hypothetical protein